MSNQKNIFGRAADIVLLLILGVFVTLFFAVFILLTVSAISTNWHEFVKNFFNDNPVVFVTILLIGGTIFALANRSIIED